MKGLLLALLLSTVIGAGLGVGYARFLRAPPAAESPAGPRAKDGKESGKEKHEKEKSGKPKADDHTSGGKALAGGVALPPVVAALVAPEGVWLRIDASIVVDDVEEKDLETLKRAVAGDVMAYVATLSLPQVQGALGLQHLREDLEERVVLRSKGKAHSLVINGLVIQ